MRKKTHTLHKPHTHMLPDGIEGRDPLSLLPIQAIYMSKRREWQAGCGAGNGVYLVGQVVAYYMWQRAVVDGEWWRRDSAWGVGRPRGRVS
jgi:hypothetical protein